MSVMSTLAEKVGLTTNRVAAIARELGYDSNSLNQSNQNDIESVASLMRTKGISSVSQAVSEWKGKSNSRESFHQNVDENKDVGVTEVLKGDYQIAQNLAVRRAAGIVETSNNMVASILYNGFDPKLLEQLGMAQLKEHMKESQLAIEEAALGRMNRTNNYLPAAAQTIEVTSTKQLPSTRSPEPQQPTKSE